MWGGEKFIAGDAFEYSFMAGGVVEVVQDGTKAMTPHNSSDSSVGMEILHTWPCCCCT